MEVNKNSAKDMVDGSGGLSSRAVAMAPNVGSESPPSASRLISITTDDQRSVEVTFLPAQKLHRGVLLFSHGYRSAPKHYYRLLRAWSDAGYDIYAPLHIDSAEYPDYEQYPQELSWPTRLYDMRAAAGVANTDRFIAAGHSYGATVALTLAGATAVVPSSFTPQSMRDPRAVAALSLSPPGAIPGLISPEGYRTIAVPTLVQTGDRDTFAPEIPWQSHLIAYEQAPAGAKYSLVLQGVDHGFGGLIYDPIMFAFNDQRAQLGEMIRFSLLFVNAFSGSDIAAKERLDDAVGLAGSAHLAGG